MGYSQYILSPTDRAACIWVQAQIHCLISLTDVTSLLIEKLR